MAQVPAPAAVPVVVVAGDTVVGQALALLLRSTRYEARFATLSDLYHPGLLETACLLLLAPGLDTEDRSTVLTLAWDKNDLRNGIPVVELVTGELALRPSERHYTAPWPCRTKDLERQIEAALGAGPEMDGHGEDRTRQNRAG